MKLSFKNKIAEFNFLPSLEIWKTKEKVEIGDLFLNVELHLKYLSCDEIEGTMFSEFLTFLDENINGLNIKASQLLKALYKAMGWAEHIEKYKFKLVAIFFEGKNKSHIFEDSVYNYSLLFELYNEDFMECDDPYGNYFVKVENLLITGCYREQI